MQDNFRDAFWSPVAATEPIPNYTIGLHALHDKLSTSVLENDAITAYLQKRIDTENACADLMLSDLSSAMATASASVESTMNASLKSSFDMVCQESTETGHCHRVRAGLLAQDVLEPLANFSRLFKDQLQSKKSRLEEDILEFEHAAQSALLTRSVYWSRCRALELACPDFRPPVPFGFQEDDDGDEDDMNEIDEDDVKDAQFVGGRQRSSSVTSELNVDHGGVRLGKCTVLPYRDVAISVNRMQKMITGTKTSPTTPQKYLGKHIFEWIRDYCATPPHTSQQQEVTLDTESQEICKHLVALKFLRCVPKEKSGFDLDQYYEVQQNVVERYLRKTRIRRSVDNGQPESTHEGEMSMTLEVPSSSPSQSNGNAAVNAISGFFGRFSPHKKPAVDLTTKVHVEMVEADEAYKKKIKAVNQMRKLLEESLAAHFDELQQLEMDRVNAIKHAFVTMATALSGTLPMFKETYDRITLFQEPLKPEQNIHYIVEQFKTGEYCPRPMIYENYYHGAAIDQIFGVPLEEVAQIYGSYVPPIVNKGLKIIDAGLALKKKDEVNKLTKDVWFTMIPMKEVNKLCDEIDSLAGSKLKQVLEKFNLNELANIIRVYLLELPECLLTFDLYDPVKILYATPQDTESRLMSVSKLLATLPSPNYHTLKALSHHLFKLLKQTNDDDLLNQLISLFASILMRPRITSSVNMHDRHPKRLVRDLLTCYDTIFTKAVNRAQKSSASRSAIVADNTSATTLFVSPPMNDTVPDHSNTTESALRRTLLNIMRRNSAETGTHANHDAPPDSPGGPPIVPHSKLTLFEDPDKSEPTPKQSGTSTPRESIKDTPILDDDDRVDAERLSTDVSLMLDLDDQDDAVEITDKDDVDRRRLTPTSERTPNRSRASTRGTLDNVDLDPFFDD
ncbi:rhoGAP and Fes/CIP4 domain protein [Mucor ambiguus]|uniref:RhoGAP and Fes/CIP4 domain protein n=1 Tax=Mucor ambiguus TaxID=91626 RepID=A0A0C9LQK9_9FUNG|nr:rhoGAP and Fes/CIP4 domain protein [Mucor ambiguus]